MREIWKNVRLLGSKCKVLCVFDTVTIFDSENEFDEGYTIYVHPITGSKCEI